MKMGSVFPGTIVGRDPIAIRDYVQAVEGLGYDYLVTWEFLLADACVHEPFTLLSYLAGVTETLELATSIMVLPQRRTVLVAKQAAEVDVLSGGRFRFGVSVGREERIYQALDADFHNRGRMIEEQITLLRELWTKPAVTFSGEFHALEEVHINPQPIQQPIPIWMGGWADAVLRRTARLADGYMGGKEKPEDSWEPIAKLSEYLEQEGRDAAGFGISAELYADNLAQDDWGEQLQAWQEVGVTHVDFLPSRSAPRTVEGRVEALRHFKAEVGL